MHCAQLDEALLGLPSYTHLAFTSRNGILAVLERLQHLKGGKHVTQNGRQ
jgi:uroporphyrinogen-III synthase